MALCKILTNRHFSHYLCHRKCWALAKISSAQFKTIEEIREQLNLFIGQDKDFSLGKLTREQLMQYLPKSQEELPLRNMNDSLDTGIVPLSQDPVLRNKYISNLGQLRLGRFMEDMDLFAGHIAFKHVLYPSLPKGLPSPILIVTVSVSQIDFLEQMKVCTIDDEIKSPWKPWLSNVRKYYPRMNRGIQHIMLPVIMLSMFKKWMAINDNASVTENDAEKDICEIFMYKSVKKNKKTLESENIYSISDIRLYYKFAIKSTEDVHLTGHVSWVGKTSIEVVVWMHQKINGKQKQITRAIFLMAARNSKYSGSAFINALKINNAEEQMLFSKGEERRIKRQQMMKDSLFTAVPNEEEVHLIHSLFLSTLVSQGMFSGEGVLPPNSKWMKDTVLSTLIFCHPQYRNAYNKIFGGFLMRQALELSWVIGFSHCLKPPKLIRSSDIGFYRPVEIGSVIKMAGCVAYTEGNHIQVFVDAEVYDFQSVELTISTALNFTYDIGENSLRVVPSTYLEAMRYLDGRRHYKDVIKFESEKL